MPRANVSSFCKIRISSWNRTVDISGFFQKPTGSSFSCAISSCSLTAYLSDSAKARARLRENNSIRLLPRSVAANSTILSHESGATEPTILEVHALTVFSGPTASGIEPRTSLAELRALEIAITLFWLALIVDSGSVAAAIPGLSTVSTNGLPETKAPFSSRTAGSRAYAAPPNCTPLT